MVKKLFPLILAMVLGASGICHAKDFKLNIFYYDHSHDYFRIFDDAIKEQGRAQDFDFMTHDAKKKFQNQIFQVESDMVYGDGSVIVTEDPATADIAIEKAMELNLPIIFFVQRPPVSLRVYRGIWFVGADGSEAGEIQANMIHDYSKEIKNLDKNHNGILDAVILKGIKNNMESAARNTTMLSTLMKFGFLVNPLSENYDNWSEEKAKHDMRNQIKRYGVNNIELVIANDDDMALGAIAALQEVGYNQPGNSEKNIPVFGINGTKAARKAVEEGIMAGTVYSNVKNMAQSCLEILKLKQPTDDVVEVELNKHFKARVENHSVILSYEPYVIFKEYAGLQKN